MEELFKRIGLGVPFCLGAATYCIFWWLDSNASDEATKVISSWLHGRSHNKPDLGNLIINTFDRIYTSPLLTFRAFRRSALIYTVMFVLISLSSWWYVPHDELRLGDFVLDVVCGLPLFIALYFCYLILVRRLLIISRDSPISFSIRYLLSTVIAIVLGAWLVRDISLPRVNVVIAVATPLILQLWFPLFVLSSLVARLVFWIFRAVEWAQWFLKQGDAHPFKTIGVIATIIVFGSAILVKEGWALLGVLGRS
jgi:hypothetical protein